MEPHQIRPHRPISDPQRDLLANSGTERYLSGMDENDEQIRVDLPAAAKEAFRKSLGGVPIALAVRAFVRQFAAGEFVYDGQADKIKKGKG